MNLESRFFKRRIAINRTARSVRYQNINLFPARAGKNFEREVR